MVARRGFLQTMMAMGLMPSVLGTFASGEDKEKRARKVIKPKRLVAGQTLGLIAPASNVWENEDIRYAMEIVESLGFRVKAGEYLYHRKGYLAGEDAHRAKDINRMFADPGVHGIIALRGGYGTPRILPYLDYGTIAANPKVLMGYSDLTALLTAISVKTGLVTFHGPMANQEFSAYTLAQFKQVLVEAQPDVILAHPPPFEAVPGKVEHDNRLTRLVPGKARGALVGGNLSLLTKLMGTPYEPDFTGKILFLEEIGEEPYRIDGMLTHLWLTGKLNRVKGIAFGKFTDCEPEGSNSLSIEHILTERCKELGVPAIRGLMIGHVADHATLPLGIEAELDVDEGTLKLLEAAVL